MKHFQMQFNHFLNAYYKNAKLRNPMFSLRAFAKQLSMNSGSLSLLMKGQRGLSREKAMDLLKKLSADKDTIDKVFHRLSEEEDFVFDEKFADFSTYEILSEENMNSFLEDDLSLKILALAETEGFKFEKKLISQRLSVNEERTEKVMDLLSEKGYFDLDKARRKNNKYFQTTDSKTNQRIRNFHKKSLFEASEKIETVPTDQRDMTSCVFACSPEKFEEAQDLIRSFHQQLMALMSLGSKKEVFKLNIQLYPCSINSSQDGENK